MSYSAGTRDRPRQPWHSHDADYALKKAQYTVVVVPERVGGDYENWKSLEKPEQEICDAIDIRVAHRTGQVFDIQIAC